MTSINKKRVISPEVQAKGSAALAQYREDKKFAERKGGKFLALWLEEQEIKRAQKRVSPQQAIRNFCNDCVGGKKEDITNCSSKKCSLYMYRPYQRGEA